MNITKTSKIFLGDTEIYRVEYQGTVIWKKQVVPPTPTGGTIAYNANGNVIASLSENTTDIPARWLADNKNVASVVFGKNIYEVGEYAFNSCSNLTSVTFNNKVEKIRSGAFISCNLSTLDFSNIPYLDYIADWAFDGNNNLTQVNWGDCIVYEIGEHAFYDCGLTTFTIPKTISSLRDYVLGSNPFTSITIPNNITSIGSMAFASCTGLTEIICESETEITNFGLTAPFNNIPNSGTLKTPNSSSVWSTFLSKLPSGWKQEKKVPNYLRFVGLTPPMLSMWGTQISFDDFSKITEPQYSFDAENWASFTGAIYVPYMQTVYFRAKGLSDSAKSFTFGTSHVAECHGDVRSLLAYEDFENATLTTRCFQRLFIDCGITTAPELPATTLANRCYSGMFKNCKLLTEAPELPATTLTPYCYEGMFNGCTNLTTAPELPATTLADSCYIQMFYNCSNLVTGPEIKATTLVTACFYEMFCQCTKLNYIKVHALSWNIGMAYYWVEGVPSGGTFVKPSSTTIPSGYNGIPNGWLVVKF